MTKYAILFFLIMICWNGKCSEVSDIGYFNVQNNNFRHPTSEILIIDSILIKGHERTRRKIITRELTFMEGDTVSVEQMPTLMTMNRKRLVNTNLFSVVTFSIIRGDDPRHVKLEIFLIEKWYIYPGLIFSYGDRNPYVWLHDYHGKLDRVNYGLRMNHFNTTGQRDPLTLTLQGGYTQKIALAYTLPFFDKKQRWGFATDVFYAKNHELGYITQNNIVPTLIDTINSLSRSTGFDFTFLYRPALFATHYMSAGYSANFINPIVVSEANNPNFFGNGKTDQKYLWLSYTFQHDTRDLAPYPSRGHNLVASLGMYGLLKTDDVHNLQASFRYSQYFPITDRWSTAQVFKIKTDLLRNNQPYNFNHAIGYGNDILHGYDHYAVEGLDFAYVKNSLRYEFISTDFKLNKVPVIRNKIWKGFWDVPLRCYLTANVDAGYAHLPDDLTPNTFNNRLMYGYGVGVDIVLYHNIVIQLDYSFNHTGEGGFFYRQKSSF